MKVDPQMQAILDRVAEARAKPIHELTPAEARIALQKMFALFRSSTPREVGRCEDRKIAGPGGDIPVRIYTPAGAGPFPAMVFFHGGGWVLGNLDTHDSVCRDITAGAECVTVSVDYRLAPENKFPAAPEDCYCATKWVADHASEIGVDRNLIAVGGDSAGGNLAAVVALMARDRGGPRIAYQLLIYPAIDPADATPSQREFDRDGFILSRADMEWFWGHYLENANQRSNPYACPSRASSLAGLPPAFVLTAELDPLRDEGESYAAMLNAAGVRVTARRYNGVCHGFLGMGLRVDAGKRAIDECCADLRDAFGK